MIRLTKDGKVQKKLKKPGFNQIMPKKGDTVEVHYEGKLKDGSVFDSSYDGKPFSTEIGVGKVIKGWDLGIMNMGVGEQAILIIDPAYGYGFKKDVGPIPAGSTLFF